MTEGNLLEHRTEEHRKLGAILDKGLEILDTLVVLPRIPRHGTTTPILPSVEKLLEPVETVARILGEPSAGDGGRPSRRSGDDSRHICL